MFVRMNIVQNGIAMTTRAMKTDDELLAEIAEEVRDHEDVLLNDYKNHKGSWKYSYLYACICAKNIVSGKYEQHFNIVMIFAIIFAGILVGIQCYPRLENNYIVTAIENSVIALFFLECVIKVLAEGLKPYKYFLGKHGWMNTFDFFIVILCAPFISDIFVGKSPIVRLVSRLFRLVRISKLANQIPALQVILRGLAGGLKSITYIAVFLLLVFYVFAIFGVILFRDNDPFHFRTVPVSLLTLFQCCTLENWSEILYINVYGCREYPSIFFFSESDMDSETWADLDDMYKCTDSYAQPVVASVYMLSYVIIASFIMLSLFVGIVTMNMQESLNEMRMERENAARKNRLMKQAYEMKVLVTKAKTLLTKVDTETSSRDAVSSAVRSMKRLDNPNIMKEKRRTSVLDFVKAGAKKSLEVARETTKYAFTRSSVEERRKMENMKEMKKMLRQAWGGSNYSDTDHHSGHDVHELVARMALKAKGILTNKIFNNFITLTIFLTAILVGLECDDRRNELVETYNILEECIFYIFLFEITLRWAADEFHFNFFANFWNVFDLIVIVGSKIRAEGNFVIMLRIFRLFRVLKLTKSIPQLSVIINALFTALMSIGYVLCVIFLYYYIFAILGVTIFGDNDKYYFATLHSALVALFQIATLDNWSQVMYRNVYGCDVYPPFLSTDASVYGFCPTPKALGLWAVLYFIVFVTIGAFVMLTLFVGVVTTSMDEASKNQIIEMALNEKVKEACNDQGVSEEQLGLYRRVFHMLDFDGGGSIEAQELRLGLNCINVYPSDQELEKWILEVDIDKSGSIEIIEFITFMTNIKKKKEMEMLLQKANVIAKKLLVSHRKRKEEGKLRAQKRAQNPESDDDESLVTKISKFISPMSFRRGASRRVRRISEPTRKARSTKVFEALTGFRVDHHPAVVIDSKPGGSAKLPPRKTKEPEGHRSSLFGSLAGAMRRFSITSDKSDAKDFIEKFKEKKREEKSRSMRAFENMLKDNDKNDDDDDDDDKSSNDNVSSDGDGDTDRRIEDVVTHKPVPTIDSAKSVRVSSSSPSSFRRGDGRDAAVAPTTVSAPLVVDGPGPLASSNEASSKYSNNNKEEEEGSGVVGGTTIYLDGPQPSPSPLVSGMSTSQTVALLQFPPMAAPRPRDPVASESNRAKRSLFT